MELYHYGIKRRSGRYPWGSGKNPYQSEEISEKLKKEDFTLKKGSNLSRLSLSKLENEKNIRKYVSISNEVEKKMGGHIFEWI